MPRVIAHYTLVRLLPHVDAGEFANIGVLFACPTRGYFEFRLIQSYGRVTRFFESFSNELFVRVRSGVEAELNYIRADLGTVKSRDKEVVIRVLQDLTKPRESMFRFSPLRVVLTADPDAEMDRLMARYVQRTAEVLHQRNEELLARHVGQLLKTSQWGALFGPGQIGPPEFPVQLPLVHTRDAQVLAAIKPLDLTQLEPGKIYEHGDLWIGRLRRLKQLGALPARMLVPVNGPQVGDPPRHRAYVAIVDELRAIGVEVTQATDHARILEFVQESVAASTT